MKSGQISNIFIYTCRYKDIIAMVRNYKRKTNRCNLDETKMKLAIKDVISKKYNTSQAADFYDLKRTNLRDRIKK